MSQRLELHLARDLSTPYEVASEVLQAGPDRWLPGFEEHEGQITARLAMASPGGRMARRVAIQLGQVQPFGYGLSVRLEWQDARRPALYPRLEGHLRAERGEEGRCRLRFDAGYAPPAGPLGGSADRAVLHRVAESTVGDFFDTIAERLGGADASV